MSSLLKKSHLRKFAKLKTKLFKFTDKKQICVCLFNSRKLFYIYTYIKGGGEREREREQQSSRSFP